VKNIIKVLSTRLNIVLPKMIDFSQSILLRGRELLESVVIVNETMK